MTAAVVTRSLTPVTNPRTAAGVHQMTTYAEERRESSLCTAEGQRLGLYTIIEESGPVSIFGLARDAGIPMSLALRWLASQTQSGHVVRDVVTGRYRTWCILPDPEEGTS